MLSRKLFGRWIVPSSLPQHLAPFARFRSSFPPTDRSRVAQPPLAPASAGSPCERPPSGHCQGAQSSSPCGGPCSRRTWSALHQRLQTRPSLPALLPTSVGYSQFARQPAGSPGRGPGRCSTRTGRGVNLMSSMVDATPSKVRPYLRLIRLDRPTGTWLVYWPCAWGIALAAEPGHLPSLYLLGLCGLGALVVRGAGCTINDMWDKDFDKAVERTRSRPIASGAISRAQALVFLGGQLTLALAVLLTLNPYSVTLGVFAVVPMVLYPLAKRYTNWPQIFLGVTTNFSALIGYSAVRGSCDWSIVLPLYVSCIAWTVIYDTIYGHQDKRDDLALGLGSTSIRMGDNTRYWLTGFGAAMASGLVLVGATAGQTAAYYLAVALTAAHVANQVWTVDIHDPQDCWTKFRSNIRLGAIIFAGIIAGTLAKVSTKESGSSTNSDEEEKGETTHNK